jgi:hypothetical protein
MCTPIVQNDESKSVMPDWHEPFPEPQTIPVGWCLSDAQFSYLTVKDAESGVDKE